LLAVRIAESPNPFHPAGGGKTVLPSPKPAIKISIDLGLDEPVVAILQSIDDIQGFGVGVGEDQKIIVHQIHLHSGFFN
jgi:hypothetical protein